MKYRLHWSRTFQDWLGTIWDRVDEAERIRIANAINMLSRKLMDNPLGNSESREGKKRVAFESPLAVHFSIDFEKDIVNILGGAYSS